MLLGNITYQVHKIIDLKHESASEAHQVCTRLHFENMILTPSLKIFRESAGHQPKGIMPQTVNPDEETVPGIEHPGSTGVIYCSDRAMANGFTYANASEWANLGQGAPEVGTLPVPGVPPRPNKVEFSFESLEYAPTTGVKGECVWWTGSPPHLNSLCPALRDAVANLYNVTYRQGKESQYTHENVCIVPGGRAGLSRVAAVIANVYCVNNRSSGECLSEVDDFS